MKQSHRSILRSWVWKGKRTLAGGRSLTVRDLRAVHASVLQAVTLQGAPSPATCSKLVNM